MNTYMIGGKKILALIPARGGSKGIKDKNIISICGKPLISYTIDAAMKSEFVDKVIVSTDSERIKNVAIECGACVPFMRPKEFATDTAKTIDVVLHAIQMMHDLGETYDILVLLQPTSPLRTKEDLDGAIQKFINNGCKALATISLVNDSPILIRTIVDSTHMKKLLPMDSTVRRQDMPDYYRINGSIYINCIDELNRYTSFNDNEVPYIIPQERAVDIDDYKDLEVVKYYLTCECIDYKKN